MTTLHDTTVLTKKIALFSALGLVALLILIFTIRLGKSIKNYFLPPGPPPPTAAYGTLPNQVFPDNVTKEKLTYTLDTISGVLPTFPTQMKVFKVSHNEPGLLDIDRARQKVANVGFVSNESKLSDEVYRWTDDSELKRTITMNTTTLNFSMTTLFTAYAPVVNGQDVPDETGATENSKGFLSSMGLLPEDVDPSKTEPELYTLKNGILIPATSLSTTQVIRVDLFQKDKETLPMYYPHPPYSTMHFLVGGGGNAGTVVDAAFTHNNIDKDGETYPIKSADQAFSELQQGKAYVAAFFGTKRSVKIDDITLGYYLPDSPTDYLMPIIVFHGDNNFFAYVPAVTGNWIKNVN
jgi:hypothetical protein